MESQRIDFNTMSNRKPDVEIMDMAEKGTRAGRKRAIPPEMAKVVWEILAQGLGYRRTAEILRAEYGLRLHWSRIRDFKKGQSCYGTGIS